MTMSAGVSTFNGHMSGAALLALITLLFIMTGTAAADIDGPATAGTHAGGRGLLLMNTAWTFGKGTLRAGIAGESGPREYPVSWRPAGDYEQSMPTLLTIPVDFSPTDCLDLTLAAHYLTDARPFADPSDATALYGSPVNGPASARIAVKLRAPRPAHSRLQLAARADYLAGLADDRFDGLQYPFARDGNDLSLSLLQTIGLTGRISLHLEEGYIMSGTDVYDDHLVMAAGLEFIPSPRWSLALEVSSRPFNTVGPGSVLEAEADPGAYSGGAANIGDPTHVIDDKLDVTGDHLVAAPSVAFNVTDGISLHAGVAINLTDSPDPRQDVMAVAGITFGTRLQFMLDSDNDGVKNNRDLEPGTPAGYPVDRDGVSIDSDGDGVPDGGDSEIHTPAGAETDATGMGIDSDGDGVYDGLDREPETPDGCAVDEYGVAIDSDGDGVPDCLDREPDSPEGCAVDEQGVAYDDDEDGVPNCLDREPNTPFGCEGMVDEHGVAIDSDGDGVPDCVDLEENTPRGSKVDRMGRAVVDKQEDTLITEGIIRLHTIHFEYGKDTIVPESFPVLNQVADLLARYPTLKILITGHTDDTGTRRYNLRLSEKRARAVLDYMLDYNRELDPDRFTVEGRGPDEPVADNDTDYGRQMNRRVEFEVMNKDELRNLRKR